MTQEEPNDEQLAGMIVGASIIYLFRLSQKLRDSSDKVEMALLRARLLNMARALVTVLEE